MSSIVLSIEEKREYDRQIAIINDAYKGSIPQATIERIALNVIINKRK